MSSGMIGYIRPGLSCQLTLKSPIHRTSPVVLSMWPCKILLASKFSYLLFSNPTCKTQTGTANACEETTNSNPPGPMKLSSRSTAGGRLCCAFYQPLHLVGKCWVKTILLSQTIMLWLFFIQFSLQGHRLITGGVALRWLSQSALPSKAFKAETHTSFDCLNPSALHIANAPPYHNYISTTTHAPALL